MAKTSIETRQKVISLHLENKSLSFISSALQINKSTVHYIIKRWEKDPVNVSDKKRSGRPPKMDTRDKRKLVRASKANPFFNSTQLKTELQPKTSISSSYIRKILVSHGLKARISIKKLLLSKINVQKRKNWCGKMKTKGMDFWKNVVFSDETIMELHPNRRLYVRRPPGQGLNPKYTTQTVKFGGKRVMFWGYIKYSGERFLTKVDGKINSENYIQLLSQHLMDGVYLHEIFQQDNAPAHTSEKTRTFMSENGIQLLEDWPPQSPDLNIIENLWNLLKRKVEARMPRIASELCAFVLEEFYKISDDYIQKLYNSIPRRLSQVWRKKGQQSRY